MPARRHNPTEEMRKTVQAMAGYGIPQEDIATVVGVSSDTLRVYYRKELDTGTILANSKVAQNLFRMATGEGREAVTAAIFWLKTRARWRETDPMLAAEFTPKYGKKELQRQDAITAGVDNGWGDDLAPPPDALPN